MCCQFYASSGSSSSKPPLAYWSGLSILCILLLLDALLLGFKTTLIPGLSVYLNSSPQSGS